MISFSKQMVLSMSSNLIAKFSTIFFLEHVYNIIISKNKLIKYIWYLK